MGCDAGPIWNQILVGRATSYVRGSSLHRNMQQDDSLANTEWILTGIGDGGGRNKG